MKALFMLCFLSLALSACGRISDLQNELNKLDAGAAKPTPTPSPTPILGSGQQYFLVNVYPLLVQQCASCHSKAIQSPAIAEVDATKDYTEAKARLPQMVLSTTNGHEGEATSSHAGLEAALRTWAGIEGITL